ncbi:MAG TPA: phage major capsid protein [Gordonia polyisoprenivorans]|uniref:phage major capsid protein n=1 Tax=uncultured Gordonia sp. TaxID=198437 RepID=UPI000EDCA0A2|nr:phage major capsid protein [uncultured Gordonia sp.]HCS59061.1 phage major capsid protein [Gordonia polyisoprenivorans]
MATNSTTHASIIAPALVGDLIIRPLINQSIAGQALTETQIATAAINFPVVTADPAAGWVAEGAEIAVTDSTVTQVTVTPSKLAGLSIISRELADDSSPAAAQLIGDGLVRDMSRKLDTALFAASTTNGPSGLAGVSGVSTVSAGAGYTNADPFTAAEFASATANGVISAWVTSPTVAQALSNLKETTTSARPLLQPDPTTPSVRQILGRPLLVSPYCPTTNNVVWGVDARFAHLVIRAGATVEADRSVYFTSDRVALKATMRVGFGWTNPAALVKITTT